MKGRDGVMSSFNRLSSRAEYRFSTLVEALQHWAATKPDAIAYTFLCGEDQEEITYKELDEKARIIAGWLQSQGDCQGERAMLFFRPGLEYIGAFMGCLYAGVIAVPAYPPQNNHPMDQLQKIIQDAQPKFILCEAEAKKAIQNLPQIIGCLDEMEPNTSSSFQTIDPTSLAILQYTSGSTGDPKSVMVSHGNVIGNIEGFFETRKGTADYEVGCSWLPPYHCTGLIGGILIPLYFGFPCFLMSPTAFLQDPKRWLEIISKEKVTISPAPNFAYDLCAAMITEDSLKELNLAHWHTAINGAEPIRHETLKNFIKKFGVSGFSESAMCPCYGMTETTLLVCFSKGAKTIQISKQKLKDGKIASPFKEDDAYHLVSCGQAISGHEICIIDPLTLLPCAQDEVGEIWVYGSGVTQGYWNKPDVTKEVFHAQILKDTSGKKYLRTGDLGWIDENDHLYITGRLKDLIILNGRNHYPQDLEKTCSDSHIQLIGKSAAAFTVENEGNKEQLVLVQEVKQNSGNFPEIFQLIQKALWEEHGLSAQRIVLIQQASLPKTSSGKVQRRLTRQMLLNQELKIEAEWMTPKTDESIQEYEEEELSSLLPILQKMPPSEQEIMLRKNIRQLVSHQLRLSLSELADQVNFSELGMDSLKSVFLANRCQKIVGTLYKIPETLAFDYPTIEKVSAFLVSLLEGEKVLHSMKTATINETIAAIQQDCILPDSIVPPLLSDSKEKNHIFITGATGLVGSHLLKNLLCLTKSSITCLINAENKDKAWQKLLAKLQGIDGEISDLKDRIFIQLGDLEKPLLGMPESVFSSLSSSVDMIYHVGANVNHLYSYQALRKANVHSTMEIIRLASLGKKKSIHYVSSFTAYTSQDYGPEENIQEDFFYDQDRPSALGGYQQSKWASEKLLQKAYERGFPVFIYRLCFCLDDHMNTTSINKDHLLSFIKGCLQFGYAPEYDGNDLLVLPTNLTAKTIAQISLLNEVSSPVLHLVPFRSFSWSCLWEMLGNVSVLPFQEWLDNHLSHIRQDNALYPFLPYYLNKNKSEILSQIPNLSCKKTREVIEGSKLEPLIMTKEQFLKVLLMTV